MVNPYQKSELRRKERQKKKQISPDTETDASTFRCKQDWLHNSWGPVHNADAVLLFRSWGKSTIKVLKYKASLPTPHGLSLDLSYWFNLLFYCHIWLFCNPIDCVPCQAPWSIGFFRQKYWSQLPFPSPGDLPDPATEPGSHRWILYCWATGETNWYYS